MIYLSFIKMIRATLAGSPPPIVARRSLEPLSCSGLKIGLPTLRYKLS